MSILANISKISERLLVWQITECFNLFHPNVPFLYSSWKAWDSTRMEHALAWNGLMIYFINIWVKVFKNGPSKIFGRQPLKNLKWYGLVCLGRSYHFKFFKGCLRQTLRGLFLKTLTQLFSGVTESATNVATKKS